MFKRLLNLVGDQLHTLPLVILYLTDGCNSRCAMCDIWRNPRRNMAAELVEQVAVAFPALGVRHVLLSGGEAMQHPDWHGIAGRLRRAGARVMLLTNGLLLRKGAELAAANVDEVIVSLDGGTPATYRAIRGVDAFEVVMDGVRAVRALGVPVTTRTTVQRANFRELPLIVEAARAADVNLISFLAVDVSSTTAFGARFTADSSLAVNGGAQSGALTLAEADELANVIDALETRCADLFTAGRIAESPEKLRRILVQYFRALHGQAAFPAPRCNAPHFSTVIEVDGTLRPCYFLPAYGRLAKDAPLRDALNVPLAQQLRRAYREGRREECAHCVCPLYKSARALVGM